MVLWPDEAVVTDIAFAAKMRAPSRTLHRGRDLAWLELPVPPSSTRYAHPCTEIPLLANRSPEFPRPLLRWRRCDPQPDEARLLAEQ